MSLKFRHGITTSSPASRDPYAQYRLWRGLIPAITHSSTPSSIDHNISRRHNPKPTTAELNTKCRPTPTPISIHYFTGRPLITLNKRTDSQRKALRRKFRYLHKPFPKSTPKTHCAWLRIWHSDACKRRRLIKEKKALQSQLDRAGFTKIERALVLFNLTASLHRISVDDATQSPHSPPSRPRKCKREYDTAPKLRPHIGPLTPHGNFFSIDDPP